MFTAIQHFFVAPVFLDDEDKTRAARLLNVILNTQVLIIVLILVSSLLGMSVPSRAYSILTVLFILLVGLRFPMKRGWVKPAGVILVVIMFVGISVAIALSGTIRTPTILFLILINIIAGLVVGRQAALGTAIANTVLVYGLVQAEATGLLPPADYAVGVAQVIAFAAGSFLTTVLLNLALQSMEDSLAQTRANEQAVRELASTLELRVEERTRQLADASKIAQLSDWEYDVLQNQFTFNDAFYELMRTTAEEQGGYIMSAADYAQRFVHPDDAAVVAEQIGKAIAAADPNFRGQVDHRVIYGDGEIGYITVRFRIEKDNSGQTIKTFGVNQDITDRKRTEEELRKFELALERSNDAVFMTDVQGLITYINPAFERIYGFTREEAIGQNPRIIKSGLIPQEQYVHFWQALLHNQVVAGEIVNKTKDGRLITIEGMNTSVLDNNGKPLGFMATHRDITSRKKVEEDIRISRERYILSVEGSNDGLWDWDIRTNQIYFSPRWKNMIGYEDHEIENTFAAFEALLHPDDHAHALETLGAYLENRIPEYDLEFRLRQKDGSYKWIRARGRVLRDEQGQPYRMAGSHSDIEFQKETETLLAKRATQLETVTQVAASVSTIQDPAEMLQQVADLTKSSFNLYHAHIYLLNEAEDTLVLTAGAGEVGRVMVARQHTIPLSREQSLVARAARTRQGVTVNNVTQAPDFLPNPLLPNTRAELAVPLIALNRILGVLDVQAAEANYFTEEDVRIQTILASQIAIALENARANEQTVKTLHELDALTRRLTRAGWQSYLAESENQRIGFMFTEDHLVNLQEKGHELAKQNNVLIQPIALRGEQVGHLIATDSEIDKAELSTILQAVAQGLGAHLENLRLTEEAERRVSELGVINEIGQDLAAEVELQNIVVSVVNHLSRVFNANIAYMALYDQDRQMIDIPYLLDHGQEIRNEPPFSFGEGINTFIIKTRQSVFINHDTEHRLVELGALPTSNNRLAKSFIGVPMVVGDRVIGVLSVQDAEREGRFSENDVNLLKTISSNVAVAMQNARLFLEVRKRAEREAMVNQIGQRIQSAATVQGALQTAVQELGTVLKARRTFVELATKLSDSSVRPLVGE